MLSGLLIAKILVTLVAVVGLSLIAEHVSPQVAGILAGYPHGIAIVLYFIGLEQGAEFGGHAAMFAVGGLSANAFLAFVYYLLCRSKHWTNVGLAALGSVAGFLAFAAVLKQLSLSAVEAIGFTLVVLFVSGFLLRNIQNSKITTKPKIRLPDMVLRAALAALIVLAITGLAGVIGPDWSGLLSGFPVVTYPFLLIIHAKHGPAPISTIAKNYPFGVVSLLVYTATLSWAFPALGVNWGTLAGFVAATAYLAALSLWKARRRAVATQP